MSANVDVAKAVAKQGGINILANLARSTKRSVVEEAAGGLWNLSVGEELKVVQFSIFAHSMFYFSDSYKPECPL